MDSLPLLRRRKEKSFHHWNFKGNTFNSEDCSARPPYRFKYFNILNDTKSPLRTRKLSIIACADGIIVLRYVVKNWTCARKKKIRKEFLIIFVKQNWNCFDTSDAVARYWMGSHAYIVNECARTNQIVMMLRMPCKHPIWSGELDVSHENNFSPFVYSENASNAGYLSPERPFF